MRNDIERIRDSIVAEASDKKTIEWLDEIKREALHYLEQGADCFTVPAGPWTLTFDDSKESEVKE